MHDSGTFVQVMDPFVTDTQVTYIKNGMENRLRRLRGNKFIYQTKLHLLFIKEDTSPLLTVQTAA